MTFGACHISLTDRELDILRLVCQNLSYQEIADELQISKRTVSFHISNMLSKTGHKRLIGWQLKPPIRAMPRPVRSKPSGSCR